MIMSVFQLSIILVDNRGLISPIQMNMQFSCIKRVRKLCVIVKSMKKM